MKHTKKIAELIEPGDWIVFPEDDPTDTPFLVRAVERGGPCVGMYLTPLVPFDDPGVGESYYRDGDYFRPDKSESCLFQCKGVEKLTLFPGA